MNKKLMLIVGLVVAVVAVPLIQARVRGTSAVEVAVEKLEPRVIQSSVLASGKLVHAQEVKLTTEEIGADFLRRQLDLLRVHELARCEHRRLDDARLELLDRHLDRG